MIYVWEPLQSNQKQSLINKIIGELQGQLDTEELSHKLNSGNAVEVQEKISLQLAYGPDQFTGILLMFTRKKNLKDVFDRTLETIMSWDDLWVSYAVTSLELDRIGTGDKSNFQILEEKLRAKGIVFGLTDFRNYLKVSERYAHILAPLWKETSLPVTALGDQLIYIRDLILLRMVYSKIQRECASLVRQFIDGEPTTSPLGYNKQLVPK